MAAAGPQVTSHRSILIVCEPDFTKEGGEGRGKTVPPQGPSCLMMGSSPAANGQERHPGAHLSYGGLVAYTQLGPYKAVTGCLPQVMFGSQQ